mmetsp:Transcript_24891/g.62607  ORF Transcript_24891/g.62607 Transcript_24891/m.62607 type:complete len:262 (-) Transcript_24891:1118-1903(-)
MEQPVGPLELRDHRANIARGERRKLVGSAMPEIAASQLDGPQLGGAALKGYRRSSVVGPERQEEVLQVVRKRQVRKSRERIHTKLLQLAQIQPSEQSVSRHLRLYVFPQLFAHVEVYLEVAQLRERADVHHEVRQAETSHVPAHLQRHPFIELLLRHQVWRQSQVRDPSLLVELLAREREVHRFPQIEELRKMVERELPHLDRNVGGLFLGRCLIVIVLVLDLVWVLVEVDYAVVLVVGIGGRRLEVVELVVHQFTPATPL